MKRYQAIFFDRDGTLSRNNPVLWEERDRYMGTLLGMEAFALTPEIFHHAFQCVSEMYLDPDRVTTFEMEEAFWKKWYQCILEEYGVTRGAEDVAQDLNSRYAFHQMKELYPESLEVLRSLHDQGYQMGVISDTFPSLEKSLEAMGVARYFGAFISSSFVGVMKPDPRIYRTALQTLNVEAEDSIYIDDYRVEADGARALGITAFHLDRQQIEHTTDIWTIRNLRQVVSFLQE